MCPAQLLLLLLLSRFSHVRLCPFNFHFYNLLLLPWGKKDPIFKANFIYIYIYYNSYDFVFFFFL